MIVDAVVIGAGPNGLVAANLLADAGWDVALLEAAPTPGGGVRSAEITAPGFRSDLCSAFYPFAACSPVIRGLRLPDYGLRWRRAEAALAHALPDGRAAVLWNDPERTAGAVDVFHHGDGERWLAAYRHWCRIEDDLTAAMFAPFPPVRAGTRLLARRGVGGSVRASRLLAMSIRDLAEEFFGGEGARLLLYGCALHTDLGPESTGSGAYGWLLAMLGQHHGFPAPQGGAQELTDTLVRRLRAHGGTLYCDANAERIVVGGGRALGVVCADGRAWRARRAVLADVDAPYLYRNLVGADHLPARLLADLRGFRYDRPTLKLDWALREPLPWTNPQIRHAGTVHLGGDTAQLSRTAAELAGGGDPPVPFVLMGQMSRVDPTRSPAGTETAWAYTHLPYRYAARRRDDLAGYVERIEDMVDKLAPGFRELVIARQVQGPADLVQENANMIGGALGGGTAALSQQLLLRPTPGLGRSDTVIDRLYLASASAHPGPGVHGGPGANAARAALHRDRLVTGALYRAAITAANRLIY
ncbi:NAD(P)/FAD-dependent oxidoreductase [Catellatospora sp. KI3]|uniref:phytoene desaturase family protein n=1 Tax=Catellatospora sp. KI3 TaxID=3041620 RepID=UPI002482B8E3|nr:NAD(P)/FAD-dependent oxidoreductase [Catellatospora sp. KI3]MDI1460660.1 NAD(P)/FAD-dependent oxidoreductase [Catellatospora sp. KI3]